jgi:hypothetical protein
MAIGGTSAGTVISAAALKQEAAQAYREYLDSAKAAFLARVDGGTLSLKDGEIIARPAREDGILEVPGGLVHHWTAATFVRGVHLQRALDVSQDYSRYPLVYGSVADAKLLDHEGGTYHVSMRLKEHQAGLTVVLQIRSTVSYTRLSDIQVFALSDADEIREVADAGSEREHLLPPEQDRGYLWRATVLTSFREQRDGIVVEMETLGLSRRFPYMLAWILEPIARRIGRKSVETSLQEFRVALMTPAHPAPPADR